MRQSKKNIKQVIMVLGMARCGTSTITRGLQAIGVSLGDNLHQPDGRNPKGFWEDIDVTYNVNRQLLRKMGHPWLCEELAQQLDEGHDPLLNEYRQYAGNLLKQKLTQAMSWGFKDTNTVMLLPFWQAVMRDVGAEDKYVIALRHPLGCAYSNIKHSNLDLEAGLMAWLKAMILAVDGTFGKARLVVSYDMLLNDPIRELLRMCRDLQIDVTNPEELEIYARDYVDNKLHHHAYSDQDLIENPAMKVVPLCARVYTLLLQLATDQLSFADAAFTKEWQDIKLAFAAKLPLYLHARNLLVRNQSHERRLRRINRSVVWSLLKPLWLIDDWFRARRVQARHKRRFGGAYE